jgi:hypothetical protein
MCLNCSRIETIDEENDNKQLNKYLSTIFYLCFSCVIYSETSIYEHEYLGDYESNQYNKVKKQIATELDGKSIFEISHRWIEEFKGHRIICLFSVT